MTMAGDELPFAKLVAEFKAKTDEFDRAMDRSKRQVQTVEETTKKMGDTTLTTTKKFDQYGRAVETITRRVQKTGDTTKTSTTRVTEAFEGQAKAADKTKSPMEAMNGVLGRVAPRIGGLTKQVGGATESLGGFSGAMGAGVAAGAAVAVIAIQKVVESIKNVIMAVVNWGFAILRSTQLWQFGQSILSDFVDFILGMFLDAFITAFEDSEGTAGDALTSIMESMAQLAETMTPLIVKLAELAAILVPKIVDVIVRVVTKIVEWLLVGDRLEILLDLILVAIVLLLSPLIALGAIIFSLIKSIEFWAGVFGALWDVFRPFVEWLDNAVIGIFQWLWDTLSGIADLIGGFFTTVWDNLQGVINGTIGPFEALGNILGALWDTLGGIGGFIANQLMGAWNGLIGVLEPVWNWLHGIWDIVANFLGPVFDFFRGVANGVIGTLQWLWDVLVGIWDTLMDIGNAVGGALGGVGDFLSGTGGAPGFQYGGQVVGTGVYKLHAGEFVLPPGAAEGLSTLFRYYGGGPPAGGGGSVANNTPIFINVEGGRGDDPYELGNAIATALESRLRAILG